MPGIDPALAEAVQLTLGLIWDGFVCFRERLFAGQNP
jgi:hypothetical protein